MEIGARLFHRNGRGVALTDVGRDLLQAAAPLVLELNKIQQRIREQALRPRGHIRLGVAHSLGEAVMPNLIEKYRLAYPDIEVHIPGISSTSIPGALADGQIDLALFYLPHSSSGITGEVFLKVGLYVVGSLEAAERFALPPGRPVRLQDVAKLPLVLPSARHGLRHTLNVAASAAGLTLQPGYEIDNLGMSRAFAMSNMHFTIVPRYIVASTRQTFGAFAAAIVEPAVSAKLCVAFPRGSGPERHVMELVRFLRREVGAILEGPDPAEPLLTEYRATRGSRLRSPR
jgi:LysR family nitrogen assimilation transcriptional regulator